MTLFCRQYITPNIDQQAFCQALLNNNDNSCPFLDNDENIFKRRKRGFRLPPEDFVYGVKHPKQDGCTGVAAALQHDSTPLILSKITPIPDFITINKTALRLGLTKVREIHQYRRTMNNHLKKPIISSSSCLSVIKNPIPDIVHGRVTEDQPAIRDLLANRYLHQWLHQVAVRRCQEILGEKKKQTCLSVRNAKKTSQ